MPDLPVASAATQIKGNQVQFIEVQYSSSGWNVQGGAITDDLDIIEDQIKAAKQASEVEGYTPLVLIEADSSVAFKHIRAAIRTSAKAGIDEFRFAVRQHPMHLSELENVLSFDTHLSYHLGGDGPAIAPMFIKASKDGDIYVNTGPEQELIETKPHSRELQELSWRVAAFKAAAIAGAQAPLLQVWADGETPYQRVIDLINLFRSHGIEREMFVDLTDDHMGTPDGTGCDVPAPYITPRVPPAPNIRNPITR